MVLNKWLIEQIKVDLITRWYYTECKCIRSQHAFNFIRITIVINIFIIFLIVIYLDDIRHYSTLRIQTNCEITVIGVLKCTWEGGGRNVQRKRMEGAWKSRMVGRTKENGICTGSQPNPTSSKCRKDGSKRVEATRSECHPLRNYLCEIRLGWRGVTSRRLSWYFLITTL